MSRVVLPVAGAIGGFMLGGVAGAIIGSNLGSAAGNLFSGKKRQHVTLPSKEGARLADLRVQLSSYGQVIPKIYGNMRVSGNIIWGADIKEVVTKTTDGQRHSSGGKGGGRRRQAVTSQTTIVYSYYVSLAIAICEGEVTEITRIWADSLLVTEELLSAKQGKFNIHLGSEDQLPDDIIGKYKPLGSYPAYRGLCYVVFEDFPLEQFGNRIPNFTFEVKRTVKIIPAVEEKITDIVLIPGAGEFVYANQIYKKQLCYKANNKFVPYDSSYINMHNYAHKANMLLALDQMGKTLPNLQWVALVVTWFATSSSAGNCRIVPKVEFKCDSSKIIPQDWRVAGINRNKAEQVLYFSEFHPTYGGTPDRVI